MNKKGTNVRKNTPDILSNLMGSTETTKKQDTHKTIKHESKKEIQKKPLVYDENLSSNKTIKPAIEQENHKAIMDAGKEKTTFNLSLKTLEALEDTWMKLRRKLKGEQRITKTLIVEKAIEMAIDDFESKSELSNLYARIKE